jgi:hypothetical protein
VSTTRLEAIRKAAERRKEAPKEPVGKWVPLALYAAGNSWFRLSGRGDGSWRALPGKAWGVLYPGGVAEGQQVAVARQNGTVTRVWVTKVIRAPESRTDGLSVLAVSRKKPVPLLPTEKPQEAAPLPSGAFVSMGRVNPRECMECGARCRPGAGVCDGCRK